ncbi:hypothetical protein AAE961_02215 [Aquirufa sp. 2-BAHN-186B]|uniref:Uncharacterized protein n=1 Tax=Aquirufa novilacunae TaxID=3139305 RepID=A0ABW8TY01_9BACT
MHVFCSSCRSLLLYLFR